jgi:antirestriction protein ArdC
MSMASPITQATTREQAQKPARDFRQEVTDGIIQMLEKGVAPWQKPWDSSALTMPFNPTSERAYRGGNAIHLMATALRAGYDDPRWLTYKQAADQGWQVRRGEKGTQIEFWDVRSPASDGKAASAGEKPGDGRTEDDRPRYIHRVYTVFNAKQIDNVPAYELPKRSDFEAAKAGEKILSASGAKITHDQTDRAFYSRANDSIHLPPKSAFIEASGYYGTALHELAHWTGHPSRLNRQTLNESYRFGDFNYAKEELRAELASVFLAAERGIPHDPAQHAAYVGSWVKALRQDKNEIFRAAHDASSATDYLLTLERDRSVAEEDLTVGRNSDLDASGSAVLEEASAELRRDRERLDEPHLEEPAPAESLNPTREPTEEVSRLEPGSNTVNVHFKAIGIDRRSPVDTLTGAATTTKNSLVEAQAITAEALGPKAKALSAQTESGVYKGPVIGETSDFIIQRQSSRFSVAHSRELLDRQPDVGENVSISYSGLQGIVRDDRKRARSLQRER